MSKSIEFNHVHQTQTASTVIIVKTKQQRDYRLTKMSHVNICLFPCEEKKNHIFTWLASFNI